MPIDCPAAQDPVAVTASSGGAGTICVQGTVITTSQGQVTVSVMVFAGQSNDFPTAVQSGAVPATFNGQSWCASPVPVPQLGQLTAVAWQVSAGTVERMMIQPFTGVAAGTAGATDCCSGCSSGSGSTFFLVNELANVATLDVTIPDGPHGGHHKAHSSGKMAWTLKVRRTTFAVAADPDGRLVIRRGARHKAHSTSMAGHPFSAVFPGKIFEAAGEVVVMAG